LARVWQLDLHDNVIGDEGMIALAKSPNLGRLLELDLEQDCWNSRTFTFSDKAAMALGKSKSLTRLAHRKSCIMTELWRFVEIPRTSIFR
jgi:hypothetical protein